MRIDSTLVTKIDRFARSIVDCLVSIEKLQKFGVQFTATSQTINTGDVMGRLTLHIMAAFAEFEREIIKERMSAGRKAAIANGKECYRHKKDIKKKEVLYYLEKNLSATAIAKILGVDVTTITNVHVHRPPVVTLNETPEEFHISTGLR